MLANVHIDSRSTTKVLAMYRHRRLDIMHVNYLQLDCIEAAPKLAVHMHVHTVPPMLSWLYSILKVHPPQNHVVARARR